MLKSLVIKQKITHMRIPQSGITIKRLNFQKETMYLDRDKLHKNHKALLMTKMTIMIFK